MSSFAATVNQWVAKCERRTAAVVKESAQRVIATAQEVGPSVANPDSVGTGKMPVATGFLRASLVAQIGSMPAGPTQGGTTAYRYDDGMVTMTIVGMRLGDTLFAGWSAQYAPIMEQRYGFMRSAAQGWQRIVREVTDEAKARFP